MNFTMSYRWTSCSAAGSAQVWLNSIPMSYTSSVCMVPVRCMVPLHSAPVFTWLWLCWGSWPVAHCNKAWHSNCASLTGTPVLLYCSTSVWLQPSWMWMNFFFQSSSPDTPSTGVAVAPATPSYAVLSGEPPVTTPPGSNPGAQPPATSESSLSESTINLKRELEVGPQDRLGQGEG